MQSKQSLMYLTLGIAMGVFAVGWYLHMTANSSVARAAASRVEARHQEQIEQYQQALEWQVRDCKQEVILKVARIEELTAGEDVR